MRETIKNIEDLIDTFENTGDYGNFFIGDYSNIEIAIYIRKQQEEIERLNNIINGIEQYIKYYVMNNYKFDNNTADIILYQLEKLKDSDKDA